MAESIENKAEKSLESANELYHRLVLLVGKSGSGKTTVLQNLAKQHKASPININLALSQKLLGLTEKQRILKLSDFLNDAVSRAGELIFLDNIEILFDVALKQDPLRLLQGLSRNITVLSSWNGSFNKGRLTYAEPGHSEYRSYDLPDILIVNMNGEATIDFNASNEDK